MKLYYLYYKNTYICATSSMEKLEEVIKVLSSDLYDEKFFEYKEV